VKLDEQLRSAVVESQREWLRVRAYLLEHRHDLAESAATLYTPGARVAGTPLLARPEWLAAAPVELASIELVLDPASSWRGLTGSEAVAEHVRPLRADGSRYPTYSAAVADLDSPAVFENRDTYRLLAAELSSGSGRMSFGSGRYFDSLDVGEACGHEYAAHALVDSGLPLREAVGDPCNLAGRPANLAISTLTLRLDHHTGNATFLLHWRDPTKVGHAGGLYQVLPVGVFQPSGRAVWNQRNDFDLWRCMVREYAEEFLGQSEDHGSERAPIDYDAWPLAARLSEARDERLLRAFVLGVGTDPLTLAVDLLAVVVIEASVFDELFGDVVATNDEGRVLATFGGEGRGRGVPFTREKIEQLARHEPVQAAAAALLVLAWNHRESLLT
jgi:hypothetical protein